MIQSMKCLTLLTITGNKRTTIMNLVTDPWVPVIDKNTQKKVKSLIDIFRDGKQFSDMCVNPLQRIAITRLFICIAQRALDGPVDERDWNKCYNKMSDECIHYLKLNIHLFELYGEKPFMQVVNIEPVLQAKRTHLDKLDFGLASGNNQVLFDHQAEQKNRKWLPEWQIINLVTFLCFSPGGTIGSLIWDGKKTKKNSEHAPCVVESAMHTIIHENNLLKTIHSNLLTKNIISKISNMSWGRPIWEFKDITFETDKAKSITNSYLGRLVPLSRAILLEKKSNKFTLANGLSYPKLPIGRETTATIIKKNRNNREEDGYLSIDITKHPWRELGSLLSTGHSGIGGAFALTHLTNRTQKYVEIWTGGLAIDKAKFLDMVDYKFKVHTSILDESELKKYQQGVDLAVQGERKLLAAISKYAEKRKIDKSISKNILIQKAKIRYWSTLDTKYSLLLKICEKPAKTMEEWCKELDVSMQEAYNFSCLKKTPRQLQAFISGEKIVKLKISMKKKIKRPNKRSNNG